LTVSRCRLGDHPGKLNRHNYSNIGYLSRNRHGKATQPSRRRQGYVSFCPMAEKLLIELG
jgi:hypothetical protein